MAKKADRKDLKAAPPQPPEDDRWQAVEELLISKEQGQEHASRRWKHYSK